MLSPCTVSDCVPTVIWFTTRNALKPANSNENASDTVPNRPWKVIDARRVPDTPCPTLHLIDVSDTHSVASHPVCPSRPRPVYPAFPMLVPCTVTDSDPTASRFNDDSTLSPIMSVDIDSVTLPHRPPAVITTRRVPDIPCPTLHLIDVSDTHSVASHPVCPFRLRLVDPVIPMPIPCTVTDTFPLGTKFKDVNALGLATSTDHAPVTVPNFSPNVTIAGRVPDNPWPDLHFTDVSDTHSVASHPESPSRPLPVYPTLTIPTPTIVKELPPSARRFAPFNPTTDPILTITARSALPPGQLNVGGLLVVYPEPPSVIVIDCT